VNIKWKVFHSRSNVLLQFEWSVLQWILCGSYCTASGQLYCNLNGLCYTKRYAEVIPQHMDRSIAVWMVCVTVKYMWKLLHSMWAVIFQFEWNVLQSTSCGIYCTAHAQCYFRLNGVCYSVHYVEFTAQHVDSGIAAWMECVILNIMWKLLHS